MQLIDDRYELLEVIASGGMATVWRARDTRLDRLVAVKRPHPVPESDENPARLAREARAAASINHPNLITVYDFGSDDTGPYLVLEFVDGPTLLELSDKIDAATAMDIGAQVADALTAIHAAGIVHRDVKPANIIMSDRGPLLTDFGIASNHDATTQVTDPGTVVATPSYAAPEVLAGNTPTPGSDVFSLAVTIDELVRKATTTPSEDIDAVLGPALSATPEERPDAARFGAALRGATPTVTLSSSGDSTLVLDTAQTRHFRDEDDSPHPVPVWVWATGALVVVAAGLMVMGLALSDPGPQVDVARASETPTTTTLAETTTTSLLSTTTTTSLQSSVASTRDELEAVLLQPPRKDLKPQDADELMKKVDEAIAAADEGDSDEAEKKLSETAKKIDDKIEGDKRAEATRLLAQLADQLGIDLDTDDDD